MLWEGVSVPEDPESVQVKKLSALFAAALKVKLESWHGELAWAWENSYLAKLKR